jgi:hypothetical protein
MEERKTNQGQQQNSGDMGTSENGNDLTNPINTGSKAENSDNDAATVQTRNATDRGGAALGTKTSVTGSDYDGQVSR